MDAIGTLERLLEQLGTLDGSDLHLKAGQPARARVKGRLIPLDGETPDAVQLAAAMSDLMPATSYDAFKKFGEVDFAYSLPDGTRFRVNAFLSQREIGMAFRRIRATPPTISQLDLPPAVDRLAETQRGLILVTGPTGSGKSSTLAAMVDAINRQRATHIITLEDPIEFQHRDIKSLINQREIGFDTRSFASALRASLRQDPDVILVGEMRDLETVEAAIKAAETGHLVLSTLHTLGAAETVSRILDFYPPHQHHQARISLADVLSGIVSQRLVPKADGTGQTPACEILITNGRVKQAILDPAHSTDIQTVVSEGAFYGMATFDQSLAELVQSGKVTADDAIASASNSHDLSIRLKELGVIAGGTP